MSRNVNGLEAMITKPVKMLRNRRFFNKYLKDLSHTNAMCMCTYAINPAYNRNVSRIKLNLWWKTAKRKQVWRALKCRKTLSEKDFSFIGDCPGQHPKVFDLARIFHIHFQTTEKIPWGFMFFYEALKKCIQRSMVFLRYYKKKIFFN